MTQRFLRALFPVDPQWPNGLSRRGTAVVLLGPIQGNGGFAHLYEERCRIGLDGEDTATESLAAMLGLRGWSGTTGGHAWGGQFINPRSHAAAERCEATVGLAKLVIFDGPLPFLKFGDHFQASSRLLVMSRAITNDMLARVNEKLETARGSSGLVVQPSCEGDQYAPMLRFELAMRQGIVD